MSDINFNNIKFKNKRDTLANWTNNNPVLLKGELAIVEDTGGGGS